MIRGVFHRQGPFVEFGGLSAPSPRSPRRFWRGAKNRRATLSRHPGSSPVLHRGHTAQPEAPTSFRTMRSPAFHRRRWLRLGPRSLSPPPFLGRCMRAYSRPGCCLSTSATTAYDVRALTGALVSSQGRWPRPPSFSDVSRATPLARAVTRGEPCYVRSVRPRCRFLPLARVFPTAIPHRRDTPERF
jgi:hypothetical protein